jgi:hypothetical protein
MRLITCFLALAFVRISAPAEPQTAWSWAINVQENRELELVKYCSGKLPELKTSLEADYSQYKSRVQEAASALRDSGGMNQYLSRSPSPRAVAEIDKVLAVLLEVAQIRDTRIFCEELSTRLTHKTVEALKDDLQRTLANESVATSGIRLSQ